MHYFEYLTELNKPVSIKRYSKCHIDPAEHRALLAFEATHPELYDEESIVLEPEQEESTALAFQLAAVAFVYLYHREAMNRLVEECN